VAGDGSPRRRSGRAGNLDSLGPALFSLTGQDDRLRMHCFVAYVNCKPTKIGVSFTWEGAWGYDAMSGSGRVTVGKDGRKGSLRIKDGESHYVRRRARRRAQRSNLAASELSRQMAPALVNAGCTWHGRHGFAHPQDRYAQPSWFTSQPMAASSSTRAGSSTRTSCSPAKKVVMRMLVSGVRQTTRCGPNLCSLTQRLSAKLW